MPAHSSTSFVPAAWDSLPALGCNVHHVISIQKLILLLCIKQLGAQLHTIKFKMQLTPLWRLAEHVWIARLCPLHPFSSGSSEMFHLPKNIGAVTFGLCNEAVVCEWCTRYWVTLIFSFDHWMPPEHIHWRLLRLLSWPFFDKLFCVSVIKLSYFNFFCFG